jgi:hypothetical protein
MLDEGSLYEALSLQQGLPVSEPRPEEVPSAIARALPEHVSREWHVVPFLVAEGNLHLATTEAPSRAMSKALRPFTSLELRFHLITPRKFERLTQALV